MCNNQTKIIIFIVCIVFGIKEGWMKEVVEEPSECWRTAKPRHMQYCLTNGVLLRNAAAPSSTCGYPVNVLFENASRRHPLQGTDRSRYYLFATQQLQQQQQRAFQSFITRCTRRIPFEELHKKRRGFNDTVVDLYRNELICVAETSMGWKPLLSGVDVIIDETSITWRMFEWIQIIFLRLLELLLKTPLGRAISGKTSMEVFTRRYRMEDILAAMITPRELFKSFYDEAYNRCDSTLKCRVLSNTFITISIAIEEKLLYIKYNLLDEEIMLERVNNVFCDELYGFDMKPQVNKRGYVNRECIYMYNLISMLTLYQKYVEFKDEMNDEETVDDTSYLYINKLKEIGNKNQLIVVNNLNTTNEEDNSMNELNIELNESSYRINKSRENCMLHGNMTAKELVWGDSNTTTEVTTVVSSNTTGVDIFTALKVSDREQRKCWIEVLMRGLQGTNFNTTIEVLKTLQLLVEYDVDNLNIMIEEECIPKLLDLLTELLNEKKLKRNYRETPWLLLSVKVEVLSLLYRIVLKDDETLELLQRHRRFHVMLKQILSGAPSPRYDVLKGGPLSRHMRTDKQLVELLRVCHRMLAALGLNNVWHRRLPNQRGLRILCIDGGGTRGVMAISILKYLAAAFGRELHEVFDVICGTSTGGIISLLLGFEKANVLEVEYLYNALIGEVFTRDSAAVTSARLVVRQAYYDESLLESILKRSLGDSRMIDTATDPSAPKLFFLSSILSSKPSRLVLWRNYNYPIRVGGMKRHPTNYMGSFKIRLRDALRATTAAPGFFSAVRLHGQTFVDGAVLANNPTAVAIAEAKSIFPDIPIELVVSVGTGRFASETIETRVGWDGILQQLITAATNTEGIHEMLLNLLPKKTYFRFNPQIEAWPIDETREDKLMIMKRFVERYFDDGGENCLKLQQLAEIVNPKIKKQKKYHFGGTVHTHQSPHTMGVRVGTNYKTYVGSIKRWLLDVLLSSQKNKSELKETALKQSVDLVGVDVMTAAEKSTSNTSETGGVLTEMEDSNLRGMQNFNTSSYQDLNTSRDVRYKYGGTTMSMSFMHPQSAVHSTTTPLQNRLHRRQRPAFHKRLRGPYLSFLRWLHLHRPELETRAISIFSVLDKCSHAADTCRLNVSSGEDVSLSVELGVRSVLQQIHETIFRERHLLHAVNATV